MSGNLARRIAFAVVAIPAVLAVGYLGGWPLAFLLAGAGVLGAREVYGFARAQGIEPMERFGMLAAAATPLAVAWPLFAPSRLSAGIVRDGYLLAFGILALLVVALARRGPDQKPLTAVAVTAFGVLYAAWLPSFALFLRHPLPGQFANDSTVGLSLLAFPLVLTWAGDTAAMAAGRAFGGPRLAAVVSPNKTWAGAGGAVFATVALSVVYAAVVFTRAGVALTVWEAVLAGAVISLAGQVGDVAESLFKREVGLKDSSALIPGHGGVLDRLDSLYFALPATALLMRALGVA